MTRLLDMLLGRSPKQPEAAKLETALAAARKENKEAARLLSAELAVTSMEELMRR